MQITFIDSLEASYSVGVPGTFFSGVKWLGHQVLIYPSGASIKNEWSHTPSLPYVFMACAGTTLIYSITAKMEANKIYSYSCFLCNEIWLSVAESEWFCQRVGGCLEMFMFMSSFFWWLLVPNSACEKCLFCPFRVMKDGFQGKLYHSKLHFCWKSNTVPWKKQTT